MPGKLAQPSSLASFTCTFCRQRVVNTPRSHTFTTSTSRKAIPPESPEYVDVPQSLQPDLVRPRRPKGILPVPRKLFPASRPDKPSPAYIANVTPDAKRSTPESHMTPLLSHRARMTSLRKSHLRSSLVALHARKQSMTAHVAAVSHAKQAESLRLHTQAEREDARLTNVSVPQSMLPSPVAHTTPARASSIFHRKARNVHFARRSADTKDARALHALYMNARNFITTEEQLAEEIEKKFVPGELNEEWRRDFQPGASIWNRGVPSTIAQLIRQTQGGSRKRGNAPYESEVVARYRTDQERMKRIAEELSGGKI